MAFSTVKLWAPLRGRGESSLFCFSSGRTQQIGFHYTTYYELAYVLVLSHNTATHSAYTLSAIDGH